MARRVRAVSHEDRLTAGRAPRRAAHADRRLPRRLRRRPGALLLAEPPAARNRHRAAARPTTTKLLTFGVTEPFTTTLTVSTYGALILSMPIWLYQLYAYVLPAFSDSERRVVLPLLIAAPILFLVGVAFAYFVVMPAAVKFLLNFNDGQFNIQLRARDYSASSRRRCSPAGSSSSCRWRSSPSPGSGSSRSSSCGATAATRTWSSRSVAAALPGVDPVSMLIEMVPLLVLYELSILLARAFGTPSVAGAMGEPSTQE